jgi:carbon starvation protein
VGPLLFMIAVTFSAGWMKIFSADPRIGFLSGARMLEDRVAAAATNVDFARQAVIYRLDALVAVAFLVLVFLIVAGCAWEWGRLLLGRKRIVLHESEFVSLAQVQGFVR